ncbi:MAG: FAD-dependent oxidoreductase [Nitrosopumilus sp.]
MNNKTESKKAIIIGCGVAGPALAIMLKRIGIESEIYEAVDCLSDFGILSLTSNAIRMLKILEMYDQVKTDDTEGAFFYKQDGKLFLTFDVRDELKKHGNETGFIIRRSQLLQALYQKAISENIPIHFGKKLVDIKESNGDITALFEDGTKIKGNFLVGCDGTFSKTRNIILPDSPSPKYTGTVWIGANAGDSIEYELQHNAFHMTFGKKAYFGSAIFSDKKTIWWTNYPCSEKQLKEEFDSVSEKQWTEKLLEIHKDDPNIISDLIRSADNEYVKIPLYDIPHLPVWHTDSVCLIGDAAHATSPYAGQGAAMALEDVVVLTKCIRDISNLSDAFTKFEELRKDRVEQIVKMSLQNGELMKASNPIKKMFRDKMLSAILNKSIVAKLDWLFSYKVDWDEKIKL